MTEPRIDRTIVIPFIIFTLIWGSTWIVIRDQLGVVPAQWSVTYRFALAAVAMALVARWKGHSLRLDRGGMVAATIIGLFQFCINFNAVYLAEHYVTSGLVATVFALAADPQQPAGVGLPWAEADEELLLGGLGRDGRDRAAVPPRGPRRAAARAATSPSGLA